MSSSFEEDATAFDVALLELGLCFRRAAAPLTKIALALAQRAAPASLPAPPVPTAAPAAGKLPAQVLVGAREFSEVYPHRNPARHYPTPRS